MGTGDTRQACDYCHKDAGKVVNALFRNQSTHFLTKGGPAIMACQNCHDPHGGGTNLSMIASTIFWNTTAYSISYTNRNTEWVNTTTNRGLCQVCHRTTKFFKKGIAESGHPTTNCYSCHAHDGKGGAFKPDGTCDSCHGYPPVPRNSVALGVTINRLNNYTSAKFEDYTGGGGAHVVGRHVPATAKASDGWANCTSCHSDGASSHLMATPVRTHVSNVTVKPAQNYKRFTNSSFITYSGAKLVNPPSNVTGSCYNVSCHFRPSPRWSIVK
jgi:hypothetical protein